MTALDRMVQSTRELPDSTLVRMEVQRTNGYALTLTLEELRELVIPKRKIRDNDKEEPEIGRCLLLAIVILVAIFLVSIW